MFDESERGAGGAGRAPRPGPPPAAPYGDEVAAAEGVDELSALVALLQTRPDRITWADVAARVLDSGGSTSVWEELRPQDTLDRVGGEDALSEARLHVEAWRSSGAELLSIADPRYPHRLRGVHQAPPILFARGLVLPDDEAVSVVGSRAASPRGLAIAAGVAHELVRCGLTVASGLARGIDAAAHRAALEAGGRTVAFLGTGLNRSYPAENRALQAQIAERGLVLSQFWPDAPPQKHTFLMRNATMSGYGIATVVVEAGETSGARAQTRMAVEHGRPVVLTDLVVQRNTWAQELVGQPGVHVAEGLGQVVDIIDQVRQETRAVDEALRSLVGLVDIL